MPRHEDLVSKLTEIVEVATTALRQSEQNGEGRSAAIEARNEPTTRDSLRQLFPSIRPEPASSSASSPAIIRPRPRPSSSTETQHWNRVPQGPSSISNLPSAHERGFGYDSKTNYKGRGKGKSKKANSRQEKETVSYKDVFFFNDPDCCKVPQRNDRQFYYDNELVGSAVAFSSSMREVDIRRAIATAIPRFQRQNIIGPDFVFVKAVGERLVELPNIREWNYKILKQQTGQGPVYVRSKSFFDIGSSSSEETSGSIDHWIKGQCDISSSDDEDLLHSQIMSMSTDKVKDSHQSAKTKERDQSKKQQCPVCLLFLPQETIQHHTNACLDSKADPEARLYDDIMFNDDIQLIDSDEELNTIANENSSEEPTPEKLEPEALKARIKEVVKELSAKVGDSASRINVRRKTLWKDYLEYRRRAWTCKTKPLRVVFIGEPAIDDGGPKREFFAGALDQMKKKLFTMTSLGIAPVESCMAVAEEKFLLAGELCSSSIAQGGPAPNFLASWVFDFIVSGLKMVKFDGNVTLTTGPLEDLRIKLIAAKTDEELQSVLSDDDNMDLLQAIGYRGNPFKEKINSKEKLLQSLLYKHFVTPIYPALHQFAEGLKLFGVLQAMRDEPEIMHPIFTESNCFKWNVEDFLQNLEVKFADEGSNKFVKEVDNFKYFSDLVEQMSVRADIIGISLGDLCKFITGSTTVPPLGLPYQITVAFKHGCASDCKCRPTSSTCSLTLTIPCHANDMEEMQELFFSALKECHGFGRI